MQIRIHLFITSYSKLKLKKLNDFNLIYHFEESFLFQDI